MSKLFTVAIYLPDKVNLYHYAIISSLLSTKFEGRTLFSLLRFSDKSPVVTTDPDVQITALTDWKEIQTADAIVVPSWTDLDVPPSPQLQELIRSFNKENKWLIGACFGAYALAYSGVLNGKNCCTHWSAEEDFSKEFPYCSLKKNVIYVQDDNILTSAGASATVDCILHFIRIIYSATVANKLAKILAIPLIREGAQDQFLDYAKPKIVNALPALIKFMEQKPPSDLTVDVMMQKSFLSRRSFTRKFKALTGTTFEVWYRKIRLRTRLRAVGNHGASDRNRRRALRLQEPDLLPAAIQTAVQFNTVRVEKSQTSSASGIGSSIGRHAERRRGAVLSYE